MNELLSNEIAIDFCAPLMSVKNNLLLEGCIYICPCFTSKTTVEVPFKFGFQSINLKLPGEFNLLVSSY